MGRNINSSKYWPVTKLIDLSKSKSKHSHSFFGCSFKSFGRKGQFNSFIPGQGVLLDKRVFYAPNSWFVCRDLSNTKLTPAVSPLWPWQNCRVNTGVMSVLDIQPAWSRNSWRQTHTSKQGGQWFVILVFVNAVDLWDYCFLRRVGSIGYPRDLEIILQFYSYKTREYYVTELWVDYTSLLKFTREVFACSEYCWSVGLSCWN